MGMRSLIRSHGLGAAIEQVRNSKHFRQLQNANLAVVYAARLARSLLYCRVSRISHPRSTYFHCLEARNAVNSSSNAGVDGGTNSNRVRKSSGSAVSRSRHFEFRSEQGLIQAARHCRQIFCANRDICGTLFKNTAAFILRKIPPGRRFLNRD